MSTRDIDAWLAQLREMDPGAPDRQFEAADELAKTNDPHDRPRVIDALIEALNARQALVRAHAAEALGMLGDPRAAPALIASLSDRYRLVRSYAARALGKLGDPASIDPLVKILEDPFFGARAEAAEALRRLCPNDEQSPCKEARQALKKYRDEELKRNDERGRRVLAEMDISLDAIVSIMDQIIAELQAGRSDKARLLIGSAKAKVVDLQDDRDKMGTLLNSATRASTLV